MGVPVIRACILAALIVLGGACSSPPFIELENPIAGQITSVGVSTFVLQAPDGRRFEFRMRDPNDPQEGRSHLQLHQANRDGVRVTWRRDGLEPLVAVRIEDAVVPSAGPTGQ